MLVGYRLNALLFLQFKTVSGHFHKFMIKIRDRQRKENMWEGGLNDDINDCIIYGARITIKSSNSVH